MAKLSLGDLDKQYVATTETYDLFIGENNKGREIVFTVGRVGSTLHDKVSRRVAKKLERSRRNKDRYRKILTEVMAESLLLDWENLIDDTGKAVPCTLDNKMQVLTDYQEIFAMVVEAASDMGNFRDDEEVEETEKN